MRTYNFMIYVAMWVDNKEVYNLNFETDKEFDTFKNMLAGAFKKGEKFTYMPQGLYLCLWGVKSIFIFEEV